MTWLLVLCVFDSCRTNDGRAKRTFDSSGDMVLSNETSFVDSEIALLLALPRSTFHFSYAFLRL